MDGIINVYKEKGFTSHDVVAKLRGILKQKKIGHTGTLDPDATGVLPVCLGKATKVCELLTDKKKTYEAVLKLGVTTDTQDMTGTILSEHEVTVTEEEIREAITSFLGKYSQIPPMYSALKVNGKKLYELAREGKEVERKPREVFIYHIDIKKVDMEEKQVTMEVECSKGTYIRTLCYDIGEKLGCGGAMAQLKRTKVSPFHIDDSYTLSEIEAFAKLGTVEDIIIPVDSLFAKHPSVTVFPEYQKLVENGNKLHVRYVKNSGACVLMEPVRVYDANDRFVGIYQLQQDKSLKPLKIFI